MVFLWNVCYHHSHFDGTHSSFNDYNEAVNEYKKSFPSKGDVLENTPDPAVREILLHINIPISGAEKLKKTAIQLGIGTEGKSIQNLAIEVADVLLEDLSRTVPGRHRTLNAFAP